MELYTLLSIKQIHCKAFIWRRLPWQVWPSGVSADVLVRWSSPLAGWSKLHNNDDVIMCSWLTPTSKLQF